MHSYGLKIWENPPAVAELVLICAPNLTHVPVLNQIYMMENKSDGEH